jgi:hypothetical protein
VLSDPLSTLAYRLTCRECSDWLTSTQARDLSFGQLAATELPLRLRAYQGGRAMEFLWSDFAGLRCISEKTIAVLTEGLLTGWSTFPVQVFDRTGRRLPGYAGLAIIGRGGPRDYSRSPVVEKPLWKGTERTRTVYQGLFFDESVYDSSDLFLVGGTTVVTQRTRDAFKRNSISNVLLTPAAEVDTWTRLVEIVGQNNSTLPPSGDA